MVHHRFIIVTLFGGPLSTSHLISLSVFLRLNQRDEVTRRKNTKEIYYLRGFSRENLMVIFLSSRPLR